jgi:hypothetical protein
VRLFKPRRTSADCSNKFWGGRSISVAAAQQYPAGVMSSVMTVDWEALSSQHISCSQGFFWQHTSLQCRRSSTKHLNEINLIICLKKHYRRTQDRFSGDFALNWRLNFSTSVHLHSSLQVLCFRCVSFPFAHEIRLDDSSVYHTPLSPSHKPHLPPDEPWLRPFQSSLVKPLVLGLLLAKALSSR